MNSIQAPFTTEEKALKEKFEQLKAVRKLLVASRNPALTSKETAKPADRSSKKSNVEVAAVAAEEVKRKIISGAITLPKASEKSTFKRVKVLDKRPSLDKPLSTGHNEAAESHAHSLKRSAPQESTSTKASMFSPPYSNQEPRLPKQPPPNQTPTRGPTVYVRGIDLVREVLLEAFHEFGTIIRCHVEDWRKSAFITFASAEQAEEAIRRMDSAELDGRTINVDFARKQQHRQTNRQPQRSMPDADRPGPSGLGGYRKRPAFGADKRGPEGPMPLRRWAPSVSTDTSAPTTPNTPCLPGTSKQMFQKFVPASGFVPAAPSSSDQKANEEKLMAPSGRAVVTYDDSCPFD